MEAVAWVPEFEIGVKSIDEQHMRLVDMLNALGSSISSNHSRDAIMGIVEDMKQYAVYHFQTEEQAMQAMNYPKLSPHKQEHDAFIEKVLDAADALEEGRAITPQEVWTFLRNWLAEHILESDKHMGAHLAAHGMR